MALLPLLVGFALADPTAPAVTPDPVAWAQLEQTQLPAWRGRAESAELQTAARNAFFDDDGPFGVAWPNLVGARLTHPVVLRGRLDALQQRATRREAERLRPLGELSDEQLQIALDTRTRALDAEERAEALERRLLTRISAILATHPELTDPVLAPQLAPARAVLATPAPADPEAAAAHATKTARADETIATTEALQSTLVLHALGAADLPSPEADLARLDEGDSLVVTRLWMLAPHLPAAEQTRLTNALSVFESGAARIAAEEDRTAAAAELVAASEAAVDETDVEVLRGRLAVATATLDRTQAALDALPERHPQRVLRTLERDAARDRRVAADQMVQRLLTGQVARSEAAAKAAAKARRAAEEAAAAAEGDAAELRARVLGRAADASERLRALTETVEAKSTLLDTRAAEHAKKLADAARVLAEIRDASPLPGTGPDADKLYAELRRDIDSLAAGDVATGALESLAREQIAEIRVRTTDERAELDSLERTYIVADSLDEWNETLTQERLLANELLTMARQERRDVLRRLRELAEVRRDLRESVSWRQTEIDSSRMPTEIVRELSLLEPTIVGVATTRVSEIVASPWRLIRDGGLMVDLLGSLFWTVLLLVGWFWGRGKANDIAGRLAWQVRRIRSDLKPSDLQAVKKPLATAVRAGIDLVLGYLMVGRLSWISTEIAFLVECWLLLAVFRLFMGSFDVAFVKSPEFRPCVAAMDPPTYDLARFTARLIVIWGIARGFTSYVFWGMLGMDATTTLLMTLFNFAAYVAAAWLLYLWDPVLRARIRSRNQESRAVQTLGRDVPRFMRPFTALAMLVFFSTTLTVDLIYWLLARDRTGLGRLFNVISRYQMTEESVDDLHLSDERKAELVSAETTAYVKRPGIDEACTDALTSWAREGRRGMVAIIGDRGEGKRTELDRFMQRLDDPELAVVRHRMSELLVQPAPLLRWLCDLAEVEVSADPEVVIERLRTRPRAVFVVEQMHRTFSRTVGGFEAIQLLLYVLNATSDHHFWVVTVHRPAWRYLASVPSIVDVGMFRSVINLEPFTPAALRELTERRCQCAKLTLDYTSLMRSNLLGADPRVEQERAIDTFYRLLAEASEGNPRVAMHLFADCLEPTENGAAVHRRRALQTDVVDELGVNAMFALVALRQQDAMELREIVDVTNLPESTLRNTLRDLQSRGLVEASNSTLYIPIHLLPLVTRTLRRRHLLYLGA